MRAASTLPDRFASLASYENGGFHLHHVDVRFRVNDGPVVLLRSFSRQFMLYIPCQWARREGREMLEAITFTGVGRMTGLDELARIAERYSGAEFAVLAGSKTGQGDPLYPPLETVREVSGRLPRTAVHLCGRYARESAGEGPDSGRLEEICRGFGRVQVNLPPAERHSQEESRRLYALARFADRLEAETVILQHREDWSRVPTTDVRFELDHHHCGHSGHGDRFAGCVRVGIGNPLGLPGEADVLYSLQEQAQPICGDPPELLHPPPGSWWHQHKGSAHRRVCRRTGDPGRRHPRSQKHRLGREDLQLLRSLIVHHCVMNYPMFLSLEDLITCSKFGEDWGLDDATVFYANTRSQTLNELRKRPGKLRWV